MLWGSPTLSMWSDTFDADRARTLRRSSLRRITAFLRPHRMQCAVLLFTVGAGVALGLLPPLFARWLIDTAIPARDLPAVVFAAGGMVVTGITASAVGVSQGYLSTVIGETIRRDVRTKLVSHLYVMPLAFFTSTRTGEIVNRACGDVDSIKTALTGTLLAMLVNVTMIAATSVTLVVLDWRLGLVALLVIPMMILPLGPIGRRMSAVRKQASECGDEIASIAQETLSVSGVTLVKAFVREAFERARVERAGTEMLRLKVRLSMVGRFFTGTMAAMTILGPAMVWLAGSALVMSGATSLGTIVAFVAYLGRLYLPASALAYSQVQIASSLGVFERIFAYLDMAAETADLPQAQPLSDVRGEITFDDVRFSYDGVGAALDGVSLRIEPGQIAAFVGPSGSGKTTLTQLVMRWYEPQSGRISIDGHDIRSVKLASLRESIAIVTQETFLFHDTIAANLRYGRHDATDEELVAAARAANIHDAIDAFPAGYATIVGERGHQLSGGERQRVAIARAILKDPRILILDEATSSQDSHNEAEIQAALVPLVSGRTTLVVAHRLSTVLSADVIFVVERGRITEQGAHAELLARDGAYAAFYRAQFRDYVPFSAPR